MSIMEAKLFLKKQEDVAITKPISYKDAMELIKKIQVQIECDIVPMIKNILEKKLTVFL